SFFDYGHAWAAKLFKGPLEKVRNFWCLAPLDVATVQHVHGFAIAKESHRGGRRWMIGQLRTKVRDSGFITAREHGGNFRWPHGMLQGETNCGPGPSRGTPANRVHNHEDGPAPWSEKLLHSFTGPCFFNAILSEVAPHRSNELFRVGHEVILA